MKKNKQKKKNKKITRNKLDKMSFEKREKIRKKLREEAVYTRRFRTPQSFGAASNCYNLTIEEYLSSGGDLNLIGVKNER
jgi:hypothetical protein